MSTTSRNYNLGIIYTGQTICVPIDNITNNSGVTATDVIVKLKSIPDGLEYASSQLSRGTYDINSRIWTIGTMSPKETLSGLLCFTVLDDSKEPYGFTFIVGLSEYCETCEEQNSYCVTVSGISCTDLAACGTIMIQGIYDDDLDAAGNGVEIGEYYELSATNTLGLPDSMIKKRTV